MSITQTQTEPIGTDYEICHSGRRSQPPIPPVISSGAVRRSREIRTHLVHHLDDTHRDPQIRIMQVEPGPPLQVRYPLPVVHRRAPYRPVDIIPLIQ